MQDLESPRRPALELKVRMVVCEPAMQLMAVSREELIEGVEFGGAVSFLDEALNRDATLFI